MNEVANTILISDEGQIVKITRIDNNSYYPRFSVRIEIEGQSNITLKCTDTLKEMIGTTLLHNHLEEESVAKISTLDYSEEGEICDYEACETPTFELVEDYGAVRPVLVDTHEEITPLHWYAELEKNQMDSMARAIISQQEAHDKD